MQTFQKQILSSKTRNGGVRTDKTKLLATNNAFFTRLKEERIKSVRYNVCIIISYKKQLNIPVIQINILAFVCEKLTLITQM